MVWGTSLSIPFNWGDVAPASGAPTGVLFWARFVKKCSKLSSKPKQQCHHPRSLRRQYFGPIWWEKLNLATSRHFKRWPWVIEHGYFWPCFLGPKTRLRIYDSKLIRDPPRPPQTPKNQVNTTITYAKDDIGGQPDHSTRPTNVNDLLVDLREW